MRVKTPERALGPDDDDKNPKPSLRRGPSKVLLITLSAALVITGLSAYFSIENATHVAKQPDSSASPLRATGIPASVPTSLAYLMGLATLPTKTAPDFTLTDQHGHAVSLTGLRGRAVVLEFMDPNCVDICPIVSQEFIEAYHDLGSKASRVVFLAVNVNPYHSDVASVATYSKAHHLDAVPSWYFLTGPVRSLQAIWRDYNVDVSAPSTTADVIHTSVAYFIDPSGQERYVAFPMIDRTPTGTAFLPAGPLAEWGVGIAAVAESMF